MKDQAEILATILERIAAATLFRTEAVRDEVMGLVSQFRSAAEFTARDWRSTTEQRLEDLEAYVRSGRQTDPLNDQDDAATPETDQHVNLTTQGTPDVQP